MIKFRPHRGGLAESLAETKVFNTIEEMEDYIRSNDKLGVIDYFSKHRNSLMPEDIRDKEISIDKEVHFDKRCNWYTQHVLCYGNCIGMCDLSDNNKKMEEK